MKAPGTLEGAYTPRRLSNAVETCPLPGDAGSVPPTDIYSCRFSSSCSQM